MVADSAGSTPGTIAGQKGKDGMTFKNAPQNQKGNGLRITGVGETHIEELELAPGKAKREPKIPPKVAEQRKAKGEAKGTPGKLCGAPGCMKPQAKGGAGKCEEHMRHAGGVTKEHVRAIEGAKPAKGKPAKKEREPKPKKLPKEKPLRVKGRYGGMLTIPLERLELDPALQIRSRLSRDAIERYTELYRENGLDALDEVEATQIDDKDAPGGVRFVVTDGWHRIHAAREAGLAAVLVQVTPGDREDAIIMAAKANNYHGVPLTIEDKRRAVRALLATREYAGKSDRKVAEALMVSHTFVANIRRELVDAATKGGGGALEQAPAPERAPRTHEPEPELELEERDEPAAEDSPAKPAPEEIEVPGDPLELKPDTLAARITDAKAKLASLVIPLREVLKSVVDWTSPKQCRTDAHAPASQLNGDSVAADIRNAIAGIQAAAPEDVCPYCSGDGCGECRNQGWLGKLRMKHVPAELRPKAGGKGKGGAA